MSILKKVFKIVKKIFTGTSVKKKQSKKKLKASRPSIKRKSVVRKSKSSKSSGPKKARSSSRIHSATQKTKAVSLPSLKPAASKKRIPDTTTPVGVVTHYFDKIKVCVVRIDAGSLKKGDRLSIEGKHGCLTQTISSMQIENEDVSFAKKGNLIGLKVSKAVHQGDVVKKF